MISVIWIWIWCMQVLLQDKTIPDGYELVWADEFNGAALDLKKWNYRGTGKRDESYIVPHAVYLDGKGNLVIRTDLHKDSIRTGMISTEGMHEFLYGYFECRLKFARTPGTISAFWLQSSRITHPGSKPETHGAEIDVAEFFPHSSTEEVFHTLHWGGYAPDVHRVEGPVRARLEPTTDGFHVVALEWTPNGYTTFVDGRETSRLSTHVSHVKEFLVLSLGVNKTSAGPLRMSTLPDQMVVDYVKVYRKKP